MRTKIHALSIAVGMAGLVALGIGTIPAATAADNCNGNGCADISVHAQEVGNHGKVKIHVHVHVEKTVAGAVQCALDADFDIAPGAEHELSGKVCGSVTATVER